MSQEEAEEAIRLAKTDREVAEAFAMWVRSHSVDWIYL
jgi:hypothetical protein